MSQGRKFWGILGIKAPQSGPQGKKKSLPLSDSDIGKRLSNDNDCDNVSLGSFTPSEKQLLNPEWLHQHCVKKVTRWLDSSEILPQALQKEHRVGLKENQHIVVNKTLVDYDCSSSSSQECSGIIDKVSNGDGTGGVITLERKEVVKTPCSQKPVPYVKRRLFQSSLDAVGNSESGVENNLKNNNNWDMNNNQDAAITSVSANEIVGSVNIQHGNGLDAYFNLNGIVIDTNPDTVGEAYTVLEPAGDQNFMSDEHASFAELTNLVPSGPVVEDIEALPHEGLSPDPVLFSGECQHITPDGLDLIIVAPAPEVQEVSCFSNSRPGFKRRLFDLPLNETIGEKNVPEGVMLSEDEMDNIEHESACPLQPAVNEDVNIDNAPREIMPSDNEHEAASTMQTANQEDVNTATSATKKRTRTNNPSPDTPTRKRKVFRARWKAAQTKLAYNSGIAHTSLRGKEIKARELKPGCSDKCRKNCMFKITTERRQQLFDKYWGLKDKSLQWFFLSKLVASVSVKRRKVVLAGDQSPLRKCTYEYSLSDSSCERISVCQKMFLETFDVSVKVVKTAVSKNSPDKRGRHKSRKSLSPVLIESVKAHIKNFPTVPSHYCRADSKKNYLDEHLTVAKMHRLYILGKSANDPHTATLRQYRDIYNNYFNLSFFRPKKDQCAQCFEWDSFSEEQKLFHPDKSAAYNCHHDSKMKVRALKKSDKEMSQSDDKKTTRVLTVDLQKVLYSPKSEVGEFYYKRKLSSYNYTIYDCTLKEAYLYVWDQTIGKRGSDEMSSFSLDYIKRCAAAGVSTIIIYSDSCGGQNKNQFLFTMYYVAAMKFNITVIHRYLEKGHTQMECDSVHGRIEKKTRKQEIFVPSQWYAAMRTAKVKKPAYHVKEATQEHIFSFREISAEKFQWSRVPVSKIRELKISCSHPGIARYRLSWDDEESEARVLVQKAGRPYNWTTYHPKVAYTSRIPLPGKLCADLQWFVKKGLIPEAHKDFYENVCSIRGGHMELEEENDEPQEVTPNPQVVANLMATEYDGPLEEEADPFLFEGEHNNDTQQDSDSDDDCDYV